jgi:predicted nucleic acid-binding protein
MIVVDANLIGNLFLKGENTPLAIKVFEKDPDWYAPLLWQSEMRSILTSNFRYRELSLENALYIMDEAHRLMMEHERHVSSTTVLDLVRVSKCTSYDCEYVAMAQDMNLTLVTFDSQVVKEFPRVAVFPIDFINH